MGGVRTGFGEEDDPTQRGRGIFIFCAISAFKGGYMVVSWDFNRFHLHIPISGVSLVDAACLAWDRSDAFGLCQVCRGQASVN